MSEYTKEIDEQKTVTVDKVFMGLFFWDCGYIKHMVP